MPEIQDLLIVDDQRVDRAIATHAAKRAGFRVTGAEKVDDVRDLLETGRRFDFVILDLSLGAEDGLEALPLIARFNSSAVVVLVSSFDERILAASQRLAASLGILVAGALRKPILPNALDRLLRHAPLGVLTQDEVTLSVPPEQLHLAIAAGQIKPWFQAKVSLSTGEVIGAEALARWIRADGRSVSPTAFIPVAEKTGLVDVLTDIILNKSLAACARWRAHQPDCKVAVNLSPLLLVDSGLTDRIEHQLQINNVPPHALILEITEGNGIPDSPRAIEILTRLRIRGINLSVDDFGTGHSSLRSLVRVPFNEMKIDQSFVREAVDNRDSRKVVRASASLGRELGLNVVAEGVETDVMARLVEEAGCHAGQGWLYGRPEPNEVFEAQLRRQGAAALEPDAEPAT